MKQREEFLCPNRYATDRAIDKGGVAPHVGFRLYRDSPETVTAQVRTQTEKKVRIASTSLPFAEASRLADYLAANVPGHIERACERWRETGFGCGGAMTDRQIYELLAFVLTGER